MEAIIPAVVRPRYAGFGIRAVAALADALVSGIGGALLGAAIDRSGMAMPPLWSLFIGFVIGVLYAIAFPALAGWTPGKRLLGLRLIHSGVDSGGIGWRAALVRYLATYLSTFALFIGYLVILNDPEKRGWHDKIAGTHVIHN